MRFTIKRSVFLFTFFLFPFAFSFVAHTQQPEYPARGVLRLKVRYKSGDVTKDLPSGFYNEKQRALQALLTQIEQARSMKPMSVMTDRKGTAYLTDIEPGTYTITNLLPSETEKTTILWACEKQVKAVDLATAMRRPFTLLNENDPKVKC